MTRPGVEITSRADMPPRSAPTDAGAAFMVGKTTTVPSSGLALVHSMTDYENTFGSRGASTAQPCYDAAESYFREGGGLLTVASQTDATAGSGAPDPGLVDALDLLTKDLGPGQLLVPGPSGIGDENQSALLAHAAGANRIALLVSTATDPTSLEAEATSLRADENARYGALIAPAVTVPGVTSSDVRDGTPYAALEAGIMARNDALYGVNDPAAGVHGISRFAIDVDATFGDSDRETLNEAGVNVVRSVYGQVQLYGYRTLADPDDGWGLLSNARLNMAVVAQCEAVAERYVFAQLDGRRVAINRFGAELTGVLVPYYDSGQLYGETAQDAFRVDVGPQVNPDSQLAQGILRAVIGLRMSPFAELVVIEIVKVATDQPLAAVA